MHAPPASSTPVPVKKKMLTSIVVILLGVFMGSLISPTLAGAALGAFNTLFAYGLIELSSRPVNRLESCPDDFRAQS